MDEMAFAELNAGSLLPIMDICINAQLACRMVNNASVTGHFNVRGKTNLILQYLEKA